MGSRRAKSTSDQSIARRRAMGDTWEGAPNRLVRPNGTNPGDAAGRSMTGGPIQRARDRHHWAVPVVPAGEGPRAFLSMKPCMCPPRGVYAPRWAGPVAMGGSSLRSHCRLVHGACFAYIVIPTRARVWSEHCLLRLCIQPVVNRICI